MTQPDYSDSCMLALYPDPDTASDLAITDGLPAGELHLTVAYPGDSAGTDLDALTTAARTLTSRPPVGAVISGHARFTGGTQDVVVALADSPALEDLRTSTLTALAGAGITVPRDHGYTPHITLRYQSQDDPDPVRRLPARPVTFTTLSIVHGGTRTDLPFQAAAEQQHPITPYAREAYLTGWAGSGLPLTTRGAAAAEAAIAYAARHAGNPAVFETTLKLGQLEGAWAVIYDRRHDLIQARTAPVMTLWRTMIHRLRTGSLLTSYRAQAGLTPEASDPTRKSAQVMAAAAALRWLLGIMEDPAYSTFTTAIREAVQAGLAEGVTGVILLAAEQNGHAPGELDLELAFKHAYEALENLPSLPGMADQWAQRIINGAAADLGRVLASMTADGASYQDMLTAVMQTTGSADVRAVATLLDYAISGGYAQGALNLYASEGVDLASWLTAGDSAVCAACQESEDNSPYEISQFPPCPGHVRCRCTPVPAGPVPVSVFIQYLTGGG